MPSSLDSAIARHRCLGGPFVMLSTASETLKVSVFTRCLWGLEGLAHL